MISEEILPRRIPGNDLATIPCKQSNIDVIKGATPVKPMSSLLRQQDYHCMASLRYALRKLLRFSKDFVSARANLTTEQYEALLALKAFSADDGLTVGQLSERVQVKHHTAVSLTDKLAARKLLTKRRGRSDRRRVYVKLTAAGMRLVESLATGHRREIRKHTREIIQALAKLKK
jgi:DNA-binding MarR family transcriptional regulator